MYNKNIPKIVIARLPIYLETLELMQKQGIRKTSSKELGDWLGITAAQIRKDLSQFGEFGKQGTGYSTDTLIAELKRILNLNQIWDVAVIGSGRLGLAIAQYPEFIHRGFRIAMIFDNDPKLIGAQIGDFIIQDSAHVVEIIKKSGIKIAMLTVPASAAQNVAEDLVKAGVQAILTYAPVTLNLPSDSVQVLHIDPIKQLQQMTFFLD